MTLSCNTKSQYDERLRKFWSKAEQTKVSVCAACWHLRPIGPKLKLYGSYLCCCFLTRSNPVLPVKVSTNASRLDRQTD